MYLHGAMSSPVRVLSSAQAIAAGLLMIAPWGCLAGAQTGEGGLRDQASTAVTAAPWERVVRGSYENRGLAQIERVGDRWVLSILCNGTHSAYLDDTAIDLSRYVPGYVRARYHYVDRMIVAKCFRAPCGPVLERRVVLERLKSVSATPQKALEIARHCVPESKN